MRDDRPVIVTFVGVPGSGKTTFARQLAQKLNAVLFNSDAIRLAMWRSLEAIQATHSDKDERRQGNLLTFGAMNYAADKVVGAGYSVVYDCNANKRIERDEKHQIAHKYGAISIIVRIKVPHDVALQRIQQREATDDQRRINNDRAQAVLERFTDEIEEPNLPEQVVYIDGDTSFDEQYRVFKTKLDELSDKP